MMKMALLSLVYILISIHTIVDCQITNSPSSKEVCAGGNVTLNWTYGDVPNFAGVTWTYIDSSLSETLIMQHANGGTAVVFANYNVKHDGNGAITLTDVTLSNSGSYRIDVSYTSTTPADSDSASVTVIDPPAGLSASNTTSSAGTTYTCTALHSGNPAVALYIQVNGDDRTSTVSAVVGEEDTVKCCVSGSSVQCMNSVDDTIFCQCIQCPNQYECCCPLWDCKNLAECIICWILFILIIWLGAGVGGGLLIGICITCRPEALKGCYDCKASDCSECCQCCDNNIIRCKCCCSCFYIDWAPFWYYILWWTVIGTPVAFGIFIIMKCSKQGNGDEEPRVGKPRNETQSGNPGQKKSETKKDKSKDSVAQIENEQLNQGRKHREQPLPPSEAGAATGTTMRGREDSDGAVSREHVDLQESGRTLKQRPMPDIPRKNERQGHDSKGRGLSANFNDDDHPLIGVNIPIQKAGALEALPALPEGTGGDGSVKKLKKKKKKSKDQEDEV